MELELRGSVNDTVFLQSLVDQTGMLSSLWLLIATTLVLSMQGGFLLLEAGAVRGKNTISVAQKNVTDVVICGCTFILIGSSIAFGKGETGWFGFGGFDVEDPKSTLMLIYQFAFCATAATIVSGAVAERLRFKVYCIITALMATIIYPVFVHLAWGDAIIEGNPSLLSDLGFLDYAGSTVVHIIGGAAALAAAIAVGPRIGRFDKNGVPQIIRGHSSVLSLLGTLILCIGWFGFNAGLAVPGTTEFSQILFNTVIAMCMGGAGAMAVNAYSSAGHLNPAASSRGLLGGLVSITAGCAYVSIYGAAIIGLLGGLFVSFLSHILTHRFKVDDPVDAIATHAGAGFIGTIGLVFFLKEGVSELSLIDQLMMQFSGAAFAFAWSFGMMYGALKLLMMFMPIRVSAADEEIGLNITEHDTLYDVDTLYGLVSPQPAAPAESAANKVHDAGQSRQEARVRKTLGYNNASLSTLQGEDVGNVIDQLLKHGANTREALSNVEDRLSGFEKVGNDWLMELGPDYTVSYVSDRFRREFGQMSDVLIGRSYLDMLQAIDTPIMVHKEQLDERKPFDDVVFAAIGLDNIKRTFTVSGAPIFTEDGRFMGHRIRATDITSHVKAEEEIRFLAHHDSLTGLPNRAAFHEKIDRFVHLANSGRCHFAIFSLDLDGFKPINDTYGHTVGDAMLRHTAERMRYAMDDDAVLARFGGDEFVIAAMVREGHEEEDAKQIAETLLTELSRPVSLDNRLLNVGVSIGIALCPRHGSSLREIIRQSDMALYEAKETGRGRWFFYDPALDEQLKREKRLSEDMRLALHSNEFYLLYQPQLQLSDGVLTGFEALLRWNHSEFGELSPIEFIPIAEENGFIVELGDWVMRESCLQAMQWPLVNGQRLAISVNMAPQQFHVSNVVEKIEAVLAETGLPPNCLEIEITEGTLMHDAHETGVLLQAIRQLGVRVAVDDFGTGYSSLSYLKRFPIDRLKVDRTFVKDLQQDIYDQRITRAIVELGKSLEMNVIAEGVEMDEQWNILKSLGCDEMQGYLAAKPIGSATVLNMLVKADRGELVYFPEERSEGTLPVFSAEA